MANGAMSLLAALATFFGLPLDRLVGLSIGLGAVIFVGIGIRAAIEPAQAG